MDFPSLSSNITKNPGCFIYKILKGGEKMADGLGTTGSKDQHSDELPEFSRCCIYPRLSAGEISKLETQRDEKKKIKRLFSLTKKRDSLARRKTFRKQPLCVAKHHKHCSFTCTPNSKDQVGT